MGFALLQGRVRRGLCPCPKAGVVLGFVLVQLEMGSGLGCFVLQGSGFWREEGKAGRRGV